MTESDDPGRAAPAGRTAFPTRVLLSAAAIGAAGAVYVSAISWASVFTGAIAYYFYAATFAFWTLPVIVAQTLLRRPGIAVLTSLLTGLISAPFIGGSTYHLIIFVVVGVLFEIPFLITRYRRWDRAAFWVCHTASAVMATAIYTATVFAAYQVPVWWMLLLVIVVGVLSSIAVTGLGHLIGNRLRAAGVGGDHPRTPTVPRRPAP